MKKLFVVIAVFIGFTAFIFSKDVSWYKSFKGNVEGSPITLNLVKYAEEVRGYYYYDKYMIPMIIFGSHDSDSLDLISYINSYDTEFFKGILLNGTYKGKWKNSADKELDFILTEDTKLSKEFEFVFVQETRKLFKSDENSPCVEYSEAVIWPKQDYSFATVLREAILKEKNFPTGSKSPGDIMLGRKKKYIEAYLEEKKSYSQEDVLDMEYSYSAIEHDIISPAYYDKNIFVLSRYNYGYSGGAHGYYSTSYRNFDLKKNRFLALDDIITKQGIEALPKLLDKYFRKQNNVDPKIGLQEFGLFVDTIPVNENFMFTPGGLVFDYVPYEISSYAAGELVVYIPINEISQYLKPRGKELIN